MRRQDELLALYPGSDPLTRKFIISQAEALSLAFDSDELLEFLQGELADPDAVVRHQALYTLSRFLPGFIKKRYSLSEHAVGVWSSYGQEKAQLKLPLTNTADLEAQREQRRIACLYATRSVADALVPLADKASARMRKAARLALSQFPLPSVRERLHNVAKAAPDFQGFLTCASVRAGPEDDELVLEAARDHGARSPDLLLLLAETAPQMAFQVLMDLSAACDRVGRMNLASSLGKLAGVDHAAGVLRLTASKEGWVIVYCLRALEATTQARYLPLIVTFYQKSSHEFVRAQAVRAAGGLSGQDAIDFCLEALESPSDRLQAQALESLVRLRCPADLLRKAAMPLVNSRSLRARVNAILATAQPDDEELPQGLMDLLMANDPVDRLEAAYCLGYLQNPRSLAYLNTLVNMDPSSNVRLQATKSLSKYRSKDSLPYLLPLLGNGDARLALTAARVLTRYEGEEAANVCEAIDAQLARSARNFERALLYRALGTVAGKSAYPHAEAPLRRGLDEKDPRVLAGVVEGWNLFWCRRSPEVNDRLRKIVSAGDARSRPRALMALFMGGELDAVPELGALLAKEDEKALGPAVETALELGLLVPEFVYEDKFPALTARLDEISNTPECRRFANQCDNASLQSLGRRGVSYSSPDIKPEGEFDVKRPPRLKRPRSSSALPAVPGAGGSTPGAGSGPVSGVAAPVPTGLRAPSKVVSMPMPETPAGDPLATSQGGRTTTAPASKALGPAAEPGVRASSSRMVAPARAMTSRPMAVPPGAISGAEAGAVTARPPARLGIEALEKHLQQEKAKPADKGPGFRQRLAEMTYLVGDRLADPSVWEMMRTYRQIIVAGAAFMGVMVAVVFKVITGVNPPPPPPAAPLYATVVYGDVQIAPPGKPLLTEEEIPSKATLKLGPASRMDLATARGGRIKVHSQMEIKVEKIYQEDTSVELTITRGYCYASFAKKGEIVVNYGKYSLKGTQVAFSMEDDPEGKYQVIVDAGRLVVTTETGPQELGQGDSLVLP